MNRTILIFFFLLIAFGNEAFGQCDSTAAYATHYMQKNFISDGQSYRALLFDDQIAEFHTTFYSGSKYRIVGFAGMDNNQLQFSLYDQEGNKLFTNAEHENSSYWDFEFKDTMDGRIEAKLDLTKQKSGCAVLLIGFER